MDPEIPCCSCPCRSCGPPSSSSSPRAPWRARSVKRKLVVRSETTDYGGGGGGGAARVEIEIEVSALREELAGQQRVAQELAGELDEERSASASAASEAMSMILRLQRERADALMEFRQFKRFAEERMSHDQHEIHALEGILLERDQRVESLSFKLELCKRRLVELGIDVPFDEDDDLSCSVTSVSGSGDYPRFRCVSVTEELLREGEDASDVDTPRSLERRIHELEKEDDEDDVLVEEFMEPMSPAEELPAMPDGSPKPDGGIGDDEEVCDRVYTIDAIHARPADAREEEGDLKKLNVRLQALEADRESMRQALISMREEKAQMMLLKEIAQQLCKGANAEKKVVVVKKPSFLARVPIIIKWILSFIPWKKKPTRSRYEFGRQNLNVGLLLLLDKSSRVWQWRGLTRTT